MLLSCWAAEWGQIWSFGLGLKAGIIMTPGGAEAGLTLFPLGGTNLEMAMVLWLMCVVGGVMDLSLLPGLLEFFLDPPPRYPVCILQTWDLGAGAAVSQDLDRDGGLPQPLQVSQLPGALLVPLGTGLSLVFLLLWPLCLSPATLLAQLHSLPGPGFKVLLLHLHSRGDVQQ